ncbi:Outer membrane protein TolC [Parapedobacter luteus]|uniref:Outer membrane protein TolC n=1 Tax=Parapedobacter luteus TaxID=623280 RepID=A0A1T5D105_9SPHI|nr:TolC family protein [Parapedobacter luteus]SKB65283.1 Outer membrane protein TolC [Parapedobacter luteus]
MGHYLQAQQTLSLKQAIQTATENYGRIKAKAAYAEAANAAVSQAKRDYLPNFSLSAQQVYGTVNGQNGPAYGFGGLGVSSSGLPLPDQNWNAAFGALYLGNINWEVFAFGRAHERMKTAAAAATREQRDYQQEVFQHRVKVAAAYLNLLAAQRLTESYRKNLARADTFRQVTVTRALNGLIAGVDSSQANAEVSNAHIALVKAQDLEQEQATQLAVLMGVAPTEFRLDSFFFTRIPNTLGELSSDSVLSGHPELQWYQSRVDFNDRQARYFKTFSFPTVSLVGVFQTRASGFSSNYAQDQHAYTRSYWDGINPSRTNYLLGLGITWNITQIARVAMQIKAQQLVSTGLREEYHLASQQLSAQLQLADAKIANALRNYREAPIQVKAAAEAYQQRTVLYNNGLANLVDVTQALYALVRAETDRDIAYNNVWQAFLLKAAASGDIELFMNEL